MFMLIVISALIALAMSNGIIDPCTDVKLTAGQYEPDFTHREECTGAGMDDALLGSGEVLDCGVNGGGSISPQQIQFVDQTDSVYFTKQFRLRVHGTARVELKISGYAGPFNGDSFELSEDTPDDGWSTVVFSDPYYAGFSWDIKLIAKGDGSKVMVKNSKLLLCRI